MKILTEKFPLFPLQTVLFPQARLPLHIFEPRYREMIDRCVREDLAFGVVLIKEGSEVGAPAILHPAGVAARIVDVARLADGRMNIIVQGIVRFKLLEYFSELAYMTGTIEVWQDENVDLRKVELTARKATHLFKEYIRTVQTLSESESEGAEENETIDLPKDPTVLSYRIGSGLPINALDKQSLLESKTVKDRLRREILFLERELQLLRLVTQRDEQIRDQGSFSLN